MNETHFYNCIKSFIKKVPCFFDEMMHSIKKNDNFLFPNRKTAFPLTFCKSEEAANIGHGASELLSCSNTDTFCAQGPKRFFEGSSSTQEIETGFSLNLSTPGVLFSYVSPKL